MGMSPVLQQNMQSDGLAGSNRLAGNTMFPQSQQIHTQFATPTQMPTSAEVVDSDYDPKTDAFTGEPTQKFASGGITDIPRYDGEDGSVVQTPAPETNPDLANLYLDPDQAQALTALKATDPKAYNTQLMRAVANQLTSNYRTNTNYDAVGKQFNELQATDPQEWYRQQLKFLGNQVGWQQGQNTSDRVAAIQPQINQTIADAQKAGLSPDEINSIMSGSSREANLTNQQRIAQEAASGGNGICLLYTSPSPRD